MLNKAFLVPAIMVMMLSGFLMGANPVESEKPHPPAITSVEKNQERACKEIFQMVSQFNLQSKGLQMKVLACRVSPAPRDNVGFYAIEIFEKENEEMKSYGWIAGDMMLDEGEWVLGGAPQTLFKLFYEPEAAPEPEASPEKKGAVEL